MLQRCDFRTVKKPSPLTTAAQNIPVFLRKSLLYKKHFFGWLKTANISIVCGTVTLKSLLPRAFFTPRVHPRPRKRRSRCTLDCGFKTSESPALRGFVAERAPIRGTSQPQSPAVRGFPRFGNRSLRCTLADVFAVVGEREGRKIPVTTDFSGWTFRRRLKKSPFSTAQKSDFSIAAIFSTDYTYFAPL